MNTIYFILFFSTLTILFCFLAAIISVRNKKSIINKDDPDFIDSFISKKSQTLKQIPGSMSLKTYILAAVISPIIFGAVVWLLFSKVLIVMIAVIVGVFVPEIILRMSEKRQKRNFEERYARALRQLSSSLRVGMTLQQGVENICECPFIHYEIKKEFDIINSDIKLGISVPDAFENMAERIPTSDVKDVASAVKMQSMVGGSEAESLEMISNNISSRIMLRKEIKTLFASVRMTIVAMDILPVLIIGFLFITSPAYFEPVTKSLIGKLVLILAAVMMLIGSYINRRMLNNIKGVD